MSDASPKRPAKSTEPKVFDVMRPGKAQASASGRPLITGHKPQVHDSTLTEHPQDADEAASTLAKHQKSRIEPTGAPLLPSAKAVEKPSTPASTAPTPADTQPAAPTPPGPQPASAPEVPTGEVPASATESATPQPPEEETTDNIMMTPVEPLDTAEPEAPPEEPVPAPASPTPAEPTQPTQDSQAVEPPSSAPQTPQAKATSTPVAPEPSTPHVVDKSKIVVSHHGRSKGQRKWGKKLLILLIILLFAAAVAYVLYDAGIIKTNLNLPHTHLFDKKKKNGNSSNSNGRASSDSSSNKTNGSSSGQNSQQSPALTGYTQYKNQSLGFAFAYPQAWGSLAESTPASDAIVLNAATGDVSGKDSAGVSGKLQLTVSEKEGYQVQAAKNGPTVQPNNQGGKYTWKVVALDPADTKDKVGDTYSAVIARKVGSLTIFDFTTTPTDGCTQASWIFEASGGYVQLIAPQFCAASGNTASQATYKTTTDNVLNSIATL